MRVRLAVVVVLVCAGLIALSAWVLDWSFERAAILSPVVIVVAGAVAFLLVLWTRVAWESLRSRRRR
jgi:ATP/ADP translocase